MKRLALVALIPVASPAMAHVDPLAHGSLASGFAHPLLGADHLLAMVAVGLWAFLLAGRAVWFLPVAFVGAMLGGFALSLAGIALPGVEPMILASVMVLGLMVAAATRLALVIAVPMVAVLGLFHGFAHGSEMGAASLAPFVAGFGLATAALHLAGVAGGLVLMRIGGLTATRGAGAMVVALGSAIAVLG